MPFDKYITSYITSTNPSNRYVDLEKFYTNMHKSYAKNWKKRFIHLASDLNDYKRIKAAWDYAISEVITRTVRYPQPDKQGNMNVTGHLQSMVTTLVDGKETPSPGQAILNAKENAPIVEITNFAEYASTAEARSYFGAQNGIIYYAARRTQTKFPDLGILFYYSKADVFGLPHKYDIPVLRISSPENATGKWGRPGTNARRRLKVIRRINVRSGRNVN